VLPEPERTRREAIDRDRREGDVADHDVVQVRTIATASARSRCRR
jgi:hypothetical protein